jgi:hypothetical protein
LADFDLDGVDPLLQLLEKLVQVILFVFYDPDELEHLVVFLFLLTQVLVSI